MHISVDLDDLHKGEPFGKFLNLCYTQVIVGHQSSIALQLNLYIQATT